MHENSEAKEKLRSNILKLLPKLDVNNGKYQLIFTQGYLLVWKYIKDYAKAIGVDGSKIYRQGKLDPVFTYLNTYMYPLKNDQPTREETADLIIKTADDYIAKVVAKERATAQ